MHAPTKMAALMFPITGAAEWGHLTRSPLLTRNAAGSYAIVAEATGALAAIHTATLECVLVADGQNLHRAVVHDG